MALKLPNSCSILARLVSVDLNGSLNLFPRTTLNKTADFQIIILNSITKIRSGNSLTRATFKQAPQPMGDLSRMK